MTFNDSVEWLYATQKFGIKLGLENTQRLLSALGEPQSGLRVIHVAGTNGKGSVCAIIESILRSAGYRTGLFTSPHLVDFCERIRVNGLNVPADFVARGLTQIRDFSATWEHSPTFFEIVTALALSFFSQEKCEIVILETGMGGRLDATNVVEPLVSVLTPISLDHERWLGSSLAEIAAEKAGIIKQGTPVVSSMQSPEVVSIFKEAAAARQTKVTFVSKPFERVVIGLVGTHQKFNAALAVAAIYRAGLEVSQEAIDQGLAEVSWPGRFQIFDDHYVLDGAHNPAGTAQLVDTWRENFGEEKPIVIFGALMEKDASGMLVCLQEIASQIYFVPVDSDRTLSTEELHKNIPAEGPESFVCASLLEALEKTAGEKQVLITGSLFLIGEVLSVLQKGASPRRSSQ